MVTHTQSRGRRRWNAARRLSFVCGLVFFAAPVAAQTTTLTLAGNVITFPAPTAADYIAGFINSSGVTFTVKPTSDPGGPITTTIAIRSTSANLGNAKVLSDLQWRRSDLATWNAITLADVNVEARTVTFGGTNDPWSNTIFFRMLLSWTKDAPATYTANYTVTLTVSQ